MTDTDVTRTEIDPERLKMFSFGVFSQLSGAVTAGMIHLGDKLGLYAALAGLDRPATTAELAEAAGLQERWVREWAHNQAAAQIINVDTTVDAGAVLAVARGGCRPRIARPCRIRCRNVPPLPADDGGARRNARELPHRAGARLRHSRLRGRDRYREELRAVDATPPARHGAVRASTAWSSDWNGACPSSTSGAGRAAPC